MKERESLKRGHALEEVAVQTTTPPKEPRGKGGSFPLTSSMLTSSPPVVHNDSELLGPSSTLFHSSSYSTSSLPKVGGWELAKEPPPLGSDLLNAIPQYSSINGVDTRLQQISIAPIGIAPQSQEGAPPVVQQAIVKGLSPPRFSGEEEDWGLFMKEWKEYVHNLSPLIPVSNEELLILFSMALPPHLKKEVDFMKGEKGGRITFLEVTQQFGALFTRNRQVALRRKLRELTLPNSGKITPQIWREFEIDFRSCIRELPQMGKEEIGECLRGKLASFMVTWVVEKEMELSRTSPIVELHIHENISAMEQLRSNIQALTGANIKDIKTLSSGGFDLIFGSMFDAKAVLELNGKFLVGSTQPIMAQCKDHVLGTLEMFELIREKLVARQRVDDWNGPKNGNMRQARAIMEETPNTPRRSRSPGPPKKGGKEGRENSPSQGEGEGKQTREQKPQANTPQAAKNTTPLPTNSHGEVGNASVPTWRTTPQSNHFERTKGGAKGFGGRGKGTWYPNQYARNPLVYGHGGTWNNLGSKGYDKGFSHGYGKSGQNFNGKGKGKGKNNQKGGNQSGFKGGQKGGQKWEGNSQPNPSSNELGSQ